MKHRTLVLVCLLSICPLLEPLQAQHNYYGDEQLLLSGQWKFYWGQWLTAPVDSLDPTLVTNPDSWVKLGKSSFGFATYTTEIFADKDYPHSALFLRGFYSAYVLYVNGDQVAKNGRIGELADTTSLQWRPQIVPIHLAKGRNVVAIQISNFQHSKGGFYKPIVLGRFSSVQALKDRLFLIDVFTAGALWMVGGLFLLLFLFWKRSYQLLIYFLFTVAFGVRILSTGLHLFKQMLQNWPWEWLVRIEYITYFISWIASFLLMRILFHKAAFRFTVVILLAFILLIVVLPLHLYSQVIMPSVIFGYGMYGYLLVRVVQKRDAYKWILFFAIIAFLVMTFVGWTLEFLQYQNLLSADSFMPNLFRLLAVLSLGMLVSGNFTADYDALNRLRNEAIAQRETIESQYEELVQQRQELALRHLQIEELYKEIHHRVKNNLQLITNLLDVKSLLRDGKDPVNILKDSQSRIVSMAIVHQRLYMSEDITQVKVNDYLDDLVKNLIDISDRRADILCDIDCGHIQLDTETLIPLGMILTELITNSLKYAYESDGSIRLKIKGKVKSSGVYEVSYKDTGVAFEPVFDAPGKGFGLYLSKRLTRQLQGSIEYRYEAGNLFTITFQDSAGRLVNAT